MTFLVCILNCLLPFETLAYLPGALGAIGAGVAAGGSGKGGKGILGGFGGGTAGLTVLGTLGAFGTGAALALLRLRAGGGGAGLVASCVGAEKAGLAGDFIVGGVFEAASAGGQGGQSGGLAGLVAALGAERFFGYVFCAAGAGPYNAGSRTVALPVVICLGRVTAVYAKRAPPYWYHMSSLLVPDCATGFNEALLLQAVGKTSEKSIATTIYRE